MSPARDERTRGPAWVVKRDEVGEAVLAERVEDLDGACETRRESRARLRWRARACSRRRRHDAKGGGRLGAARAARRGARRDRRASSFRARARRRGDRSRRRPPGCESRRDRSSRRCRRRTARSCPKSRSACRSRSTEARRRRRGRGARTRRERGTRRSRRFRSAGPGPSTANGPMSPRPRRPRWPASRPRAIRRCVAPSSPHDASPTPKGPDEGT